MGSHLGHDPGEHEGQAELQVGANHRRQHGGGDDACTAFALIATISLGWRLWLAAAGRGWHSYVRRMRLRLRRTAAILIIPAVLTVVGCGGGSASTTGAGGVPTAAGGTSATPTFTGPGTADASLVQVKQRLEGAGYAVASSGSSGTAVAGLNVSGRLGVSISSYRSAADAQGLYMAIRAEFAKSPRTWPGDAGRCAPVRHRHGAQPDSGRACGVREGRGRRGRAVSRRLVRLPA